MVCKSDASIRDPVNIQEWKKYNICSQTGTVAEVNSWNDNAEFKDAHAAFIKLGFSEQQRNELYTWSLSASPLATCSLRTRMLVRAA